MSRRVFLHVGAPKTGTTFVQATMAANRELLAEHGLSYPDTPSGSHFEAAIDLTDHHWGGLLTEARGAWDSLAEAALAAPGDVIISHEVLAAARVEQVQRALDSLRPDLEVHVVFSARDLLRQIPAEWQETIKHRGRKTFAKFCEELREADQCDSDMWFWRVQSLPDVLARWGAELPPERVHLITVPQAGADRGLLWCRFAQVVGIPDDLELVPSERQNESMGIAETSLMRRLNVKLAGRAITQPVYAALVRDVIAHQTLAGREGMVRAALPPDFKPFTDQVTAEWIETIGSSGIDVVGDLEELVGIWAEGDWADPDRPRPREVIEVAVLALAKLITEASDRSKQEAVVEVEVPKPVQRFRSRFRRQR